MRKWLSILALGLAVWCVPVGDGEGTFWSISFWNNTANAAPLKNKIGLTYSLLVNQNGSTSTTGLLEGLESGDSFRLNIRPGQEVYAYLVVQNRPNRFQLIYPHNGSRRGKNLLRKKEDFVWPQEGWLRLDKKSGTERMYLILSAERIYELEARYALSDDCFPESVLLDIRDRYQTDNNNYSRQIGEDSVRVRFRSHGLPAVLIEEITLRHL